MMEDKSLEREMHLHSPPPTIDIFILTIFDY